MSKRDDGVDCIHIELEHDLKADLDNLAYIFNDRLQLLSFPENMTYTTESDIYTLHIPTLYYDPDTNETIRFQEGQNIVIRYNSPVKKGIALGIGGLYLENKGYNYEFHPDLSKAEFLLINANSSDSYSEFTSDYYYQVPLQPTPFDTEYNGKFKAVKIELNLKSLYESTGSDILNFSHLIFSVPNPCYELTINEVLIIEESSEPAIQSGSWDSRVWQYTEVEINKSSANPEDDSYQLTLENSPLFYPNAEWLDYLNIYDEDGNYYTAGLTGNDHQLHYEPTNNTFTWNPSFNQFPEYFGMEFEEPLIVEPNKTLFFEYSTNTSWAEPIRIEEENIDLQSIRVIYDYNYLLKPEYYEWYIEQFSIDHSYESIAYSFKEESEYEVVQYYYEGFAVYNHISQHTHTFDIGNHSFETDFVNLSLYKVIGLTPTLESEVMTNNINYTVEFNKTTKTVTITDQVGYLDRFDQITAILNYSYGPISSFTEIYLLDQFNQTYLTDPEETFYNYIDIDYRHRADSGTALFAESSRAISSNFTSFTSIDYCRNPDIRTNNKLTVYGSELFDNFEVYYDESSIIYMADVDMNGEPDYKHTIDVDRDGGIDIIKYGIDDPLGSGEIYWHTVIQDFENTEISINQEMLEEKRTQWFDINDRQFAHYEFNIGKLLKIVLSLHKIVYHISRMILPDVDYWAQRSTQQQVNKEEYVKSSFYSVKVDDDRDGVPDSQISYESTSVDIYYEVNEYKKTIIAAKYQDIFTYLAEYVARSLSSLFGGSGDDAVFNEQLTEEHLDSQDFSTCNSYTQKNADVLRATYRKFTQNITTTYIDNFEHSTISVIDFNDEGEIEEQRIYTDDFENYEIDNVESFFSTLSEEHSITNLDTDQQTTVVFDPEIPFSHPANISWYTKTWGPDQVPIEYDSLQVSGEDYSYTTNVFETTIIIRMPNRYSLYNDFGKNYRSGVVDDGWVEFEVKGMLITPPDGQVYYTSDIESFIEGTAKTSGHYFYVDTDQNSFYETVYILENSYSSDRSGMSKYNVISIGYNYDGKHDFAPYEKIDKQENTITDFDNLARESTMFGSDWVYNFNKLRNCDLLDIKLKKSIWDEYMPKDQIFEIHKLVEKSSKNDEFSELFYEVRHKTYSEAWKQYRSQLLGDIAQQVFMTVTATVLSMTVEAIITASTLGFGWAAAKAVATLTYLGVYTLMTKFFIDIELHEAESRTRSETFYPVSNEIQKPISLNEKVIWDRVLGDSMAAALIGHPGGYYATVSGGESGNQYTGQLLVSPPNPARSLDSFGGLLELLWENLWSMGESDPDAFYALDFDDMNLDYFLLASELPSYNYRSNYAFPNTDGDFNDYNAYALNTLGYLERKVQIASDNEFNAIRATCIDGRPQYEFINRDDFERMLPQTGLYRPIVLSEERYNELGPRLGHLIIKVQCKEYSNTRGVNAYDMEPVELKAGYKAKVPINDNGFEYPISYISIDVVKGSGYYAQDFIVNELYYTIDQGNLYFTKSLEEIISESEQYKDFETALNSGLVDSLVYYKVHIYFDIFVPDTTEETHSLALAQATQHLVMDYFNQYTYAEVTANMISEIAYTETITFWSTLISSAAIYFGSWAVMGTEAFMAKAGVQSVAALIGQGAVKMVTSAIQETFEEIIKDGFIEALIENFIDIVGWSEELGFWLSSLATSIREVKGALGQLALGSLGPDIKNDIALLKDAINAGDMKTEADMRQRIEQTLQQQQEAESEKQEERKTWERLLKSGFFKGIFMTLPAVLFGSFTFLTLKGLSSIGKGTISLAPEKFAAFKAKINVFKKGKISQVSGQNSQFSRNVHEQLKKPSGLDSAIEDVNNVHKNQQESEIKAPPLVDVLNVVNNNPRQAKEALANKFNKVRLANWIGELAQDPRFRDSEAKFKEILENLESVSFGEVKEDIIKEIRDVIRNKYPQSIRYIDEMGFVRFDPTYLLAGIKPGNPYLVRSTSGGNLKLIYDYDYDPLVSDTAQDVANYLQKNIYQTSKPLTMFTTTGLEIPLDENLYDWLKDNDFNPKTTEIIVVPIDMVSKDKGLFERGEWKEGEGVPSPYSSFVDEFFTDLLKISSYYDFVSEEDMMLLDMILYPDHYKKPDVIQAIMSGKRPVQFISYVTSRYRTGKSFRIAQDILEDHLLTLLDELDRRIDRSSPKYGEAYEAITATFDYYFDIFGYGCQNQFWRPARLTVRKIARLLHQNGIIEFPTLDSYNSFSDKNIYGFYKHLANRMTPPYSKTVLGWFSYLKNDIDRKKDYKGVAISDDLKVFLKQEIDAILQIYYDKVDSYWKAEDLLKDIPHCQRKTLMQDIIHSSEFLESIDQKRHLAKLFFDSTDLEFLWTQQRYKRANPHILNRMQLKVYLWTVSDFEEIGIVINDYQLLLVKQKVITEIDNWIFSNPYKNRLYIKENVQRVHVLHDQYFLEKEYNTINSFWMAAALHEDNFNINYVDIADSFDLPHLRLYCSKGHFIGVKKAAKMLSILEGWRREETSKADMLKGGAPDMLKLRFYDIAIYRFQQYVSDRYLGFDEKFITEDTGYSRLWYDEYVKAAIVILSVLKTGGVSPLFGFLDPRLFDGDQNTGLFQPHHIKADEKHLIQCARIMMLPPQLHYAFHPLARTAEGVRLQELMLEGIDKLMNKRGDVTQKDIEEVFGNLEVFGKKVSDWWTQSPDFESELKKWNKGREFLRKGDIEGFLHFMFDYTKGGKTVNPLMDRFLLYAKKTIGSFMLLEDFADFSYLFSEKDQEFLKKYFFI